MNDRFLRACRREPVDATPVWFMRQAGRSLPEYRRVRERATLAQIVGDAALCAEVTLQPVRRLGVDAAILFADITTPLPGIGIGVELVDGVGPVIERPVRSASDVAELRPFDAGESVGPLLDAIRLLRGELDVPLIGFAGAPFTLATYLVEGRSSASAARLRTMILAEPETADALLARLTDMTIAYLRAQAAAGAQALQLFDSWVGTLHPRVYERAVAPHMRRLFAALRDLDVPVIHFGTGTAGLIPAMAEAGGDVIGVDWRITLQDAWAAAPGRAIQGNLDPVALLAPWPAAAGEARAVLADAGGRPGHIFNLGHGVLPETDPESLRRLVDLVHEATVRVAVPS
ncbi:MAG: uroporphyrinogen decarboxylase [Chloroflexota bacterium]|jgi:uroporphyrinogen decarboxylase|nr:uroporphyrinogen decarboxylase [Chloroflexota bacterium]